MTAAAAPPGFRPTAFDFAPPAPWTCPVCRTVLVTREAHVRCPLCGHHDTLS
jgi:rubrerythrin